MSVAQLPWVIENHVIKFKDGTEFKLPSWTPAEVEQKLGSLPQDFIDIGNAATDANFDQESKTTELELVRAELLALRQKLANSGGRGIKGNKRVLTIMQIDMEKALNMLMRFAHALGIQGQGALYDELQELVTKYGMRYTPRGGAPSFSDDHFDYHVHTYKNETPANEMARVSTVKLNDETGKFDITPVPDDEV